MNSRPCPHTRMRSAPEENLLIITQSGKWRKVIPVCMETMPKQHFWRKFYLFHPQGQLPNHSDNRLLLTLASLFLADFRSLIHHWNDWYLSSTDQSSTVEGNTNYKCRQKEHECARKGQCAKNAIKGVSPLWPVHWFTLKDTVGLSYGQVCENTLLKSANSTFRSISTLASQKFFYFKDKKWYLLLMYTICILHRGAHLRFYDSTHVEEQNSTTVCFTVKCLIFARLNFAILWGRLISSLIFRKSHFPSLLDF